MARKTYQTSPAFFALDDDTRYQLVHSSVGNEIAELGRDEDGFVMLARVDHDGAEYTLVVAWDANYGAYEVVAEPYTRS